MSWMPASLCLSFTVSNSVDLILFDFLSPAPSEVVCREGDRNTRTRGEEYSVEELW